MIHSFPLGLTWIIDYLDVFSLNRICNMDLFDNPGIEKQNLVKQFLAAIMWLLICVPPCLMHFIFQ